MTINNETIKAKEKEIEFSIWLFLSLILIYTLIIMLITTIIITKLNPYYEYKCTIEKTQIIDSINS